jgi:hypothetical protein
MLEGKTAEVPNFGSVVARHRGEKELPAFMVIGRGNPQDVVGPMRGFGGNWGRTYDPLLVGCSMSGVTDGPALKLLDGLTPAALDDRRKLLGGLDRLNRVADGEVPQLVVDEGSSAVRSATQHARLRSPVQTRRAVSSTGQIRRTRMANRRCSRIQPPAGVSTPVLLVWHPEEKKEGGRINLPAKKSSRIDARYFRIRS